MYYSKKLLSSIGTILLITIIIFGIFQIIPGDAASLKAGIEDEYNMAEIYRRNMGVDKPLYLQYISWLSNMLKGDFGRSYVYQNFNVLQLITNRLGVTLSIAGLSLVFIICTSIPLGVLLHKNEDNAIGHFFKFIMQLNISLPSFWTSIVLIYFFSLKLRMFPVIININWDKPLNTILSLTLPVLAVSLGSISVIMRYLANELNSQKDKDYVAFAVVKGTSSNKVLYKHMLKNSLIPVITLLGMITLNLLSGSIVVENVFGLSGVGSLLLNSVDQRDIPLTQGIVVFFSICVIGINFLVDILYSWADPRVSK